MKIVLVCRVYPTQRSGGMPFVCQDRANALVSLGHEVHVLTTGNPGAYDVEQAGVTVHHLACEPHVYSDAFAEGCLQWSRRIAPVVVHCDSLDVHRTWWVDQPAKTACTLHGFGWGAFLTQWNLYRIGKTGIQPPFDAVGMLREQKALATFDNVLGISHHEHQMLQSWMGLTRAKLVYNPIPDYFFTAPVPRPNQRRFCCASVSGQSIRLFDLAAEAAQVAGVSFFPITGIPRAKMPSVYDTVDALVVPSAYGQGYDLTIAEALARRRPVIVSDVGSAAVEATWTKGLVVTGLGDLESLVAAMTGPLPEVPAETTNQHHPQTHAWSWLEAVV